MKNKLVSSYFVLFLSGCASYAVTDDVITSHTSFALGLQPSEFTISNRVDSGVRTDYKVKTTSGKSYSCYLTGTVSVTGRAVSDAICRSSSGGNTNMQNSTENCNALLRAAGRC